MWFGGGIIISGLFSEEAVAILNFLPDPLFIIDQGQQVLWSNRQAGDIFGSDTGGNETLAGVTGIEKIERLAGQVLQSGSPLEFSFEDTTVKIKRQEKHYFFRIAIIPANYNRLQGAIVLFTDVTRFQEMEKIKSDFVSIVSHEFRTPLTTIIVGVEMLLEGMLGNLTPRGKEILEAIEGDCQRLSRLIDNLLQLSRVEAGAILIEAEPVDVTNLVQEAVRPLKIQARDKEVELLVELPPDPPPVETDFNKSVWVLTNLIGNALRYTDPGGTITVRLQEKGDYLFYRSVIPAVAHQNLTKKKYLPSMCRSGAREVVNAVVPAWGCRSPGISLPPWVERSGSKVKKEREVLLPLPCLCCSRG